MLRRNLPLNGRCLPSRGFRVSLCGVRPGAGGTGTCQPAVGLRLQPSRIGGISAAAETGAGTIKAVKRGVSGATGLAPGKCHGAAEEQCRRGSSKKMGSFHVAMSKEQLWAPPGAHFLKKKSDAKPDAVRDAPISVLESVAALNQQVFLRLELIAT